MIAIQIKDIKHFMNDLLTGSVFDSFLLRQASITSYNHFEIDGTLLKSYYSNEEWEQLEQKDFSSWAVSRPLCTQIIKGHHTPTQMQITLLLSRKQIGIFLKKHQISMDEHSVLSMSFNIHYENGRLLCTTGLSLNIFTMDKELDHAWDQYVKEFLCLHYDIDLV